jgi:hypothetical protein
VHQARQSHNRQRRAGLFAPSAPIRIRKSRLAVSDSRLDAGEYLADGLASGQGLFAVCAIAFESRPNGNERLRKVTNTFFEERDKPKWRGLQPKLLILPGSGLLW